VRHKGPVSRPFGNTNKFFEKIRGAKVGRLVAGFLIIVAFQFLGIGLHRLGVPLPGSVLGLLLFTSALAMELIKLEWVEHTATLLVRHMTLLFIPLMAGLPAMSAELRKNGVALLASMVVSLLAVLLTTGGLAHFVLRDSDRSGLQESENEQIG